MSINLINMSFINICKNFLLATNFCRLYNEVHGLPFAENKTNKITKYKPQIELNMRISTDKFEIFQQGFTFPIRIIAMQFQWHKVSLN